VERGPRCAARPRRRCGGREHDLDPDRRPTGAAPGVPGLGLRGAGPAAGAAGLSVGNGLPCVAGSSARSRVVSTGAGGSAVVRDSRGASPGAVRHGPRLTAGFQGGYRDSTPIGSGQAALGFTNGMRTRWRPLSRRRTSRREPRPLRGGAARAAPGGANRVNTPSRRAPRPIEGDGARAPHPP
jgi:hypothetical protein